jgi:hypothetical protein
MAMVLLDPKTGHLRHLAATGTNAFLASFDLPGIDVAYLTAGIHSEQNSPRAQTFEWTITPASHSRIGSVPTAVTNKLWH